MTARLVLTHALGMLRDRGFTVACTSSNDWLSNDARDRARAAQACAGCLVLTLCHAAAEEMAERHNVWAGVDRTPPPARRPGRPRTAKSA